jgi:RNA-directed DNA polymerase
MEPEEAPPAIEKLQILSVNRLADILKIPRETLVKLSIQPESNYAPFETLGRSRPFQKEPSTKLRPIDNPREQLSFAQKRIYRRLLKPICFPEHILGAVPKRSVRDNAERHLNSQTVLVTLDIKQCFPSITNVHVYNIWRTLLECSTPVAKLLTRLTTFRRRLPQGAATSPLLANLFVWMVDEPIRRRCTDMGVAYSTWIDDLAFSGDRAREMIQPTASLLTEYGLRLKRSKIKIMGPRAIKLLTGTRLGSERVRAPKEKLSRIRSGIHKLRTGLVRTQDEEKHIRGLVGQLRFIHQLCPSDVRPCAEDLMAVIKGQSLSQPDKGFLTSCRSGVSPLLGGPTVACITNLALQ